MSVMPRDTAAKINFCLGHTDPWNTSATQIGTTTTEVGAMNTKAIAAQDALAAKLAADEAAKAATLDLRNKVAAMTTAAADIIKKIKAKAATDGDNVYVLAQIPAPATPSPVGPPGTPTDFTAGLNPDGSLNLKWKCANPVGAQGTTYQVFRRIGATGSFDFIGTSGTRTFLDGTLTNGSASVTYRIVAVRSTAMGTPAQFIVSFGVGGSGEMTASVAESPRLAA